MKIFVPSTGRAGTFSRLLDQPEITFVLGENDKYILRAASSVVCPVKGINRVRQWIRDQVADGDFYAEVDDDIESMVRWDVSGTPVLVTAPLVSTLNATLRAATQAFPTGRVGAVGYYYRQFMYGVPGSRWLLNRHICNIRILRKIPGLDYDPEFVWREDYDLDIRLMKAGYLVLRDRTVGYGVGPRHVPGGTYRPDHKEFDLKYKALIRKKHPQFFRNNQFNWRFTERLAREPYTHWST